MIGRQTYIMILAAMTAAMLALPAFAQTDAQDSSGPRDGGTRDMDVRRNVDRFNDLTDVRSDDAGTLRNREPLDRRFDPKRFDDRSSQRRSDRFGRGFDNFGNRFDRFDNRFDSRFDRFGRRFDRFDNRFDNRLDRFGQDFDRFDSRLDRFDNRSDRFSRFDNRFDRFNRFDNRFDRFNRFDNRLDGRFDRRFHPRFDRFDSGLRRDFDTRLDRRFDRRLNRDFGRGVNPQGVEPQDLRGDVGPGTENRPGTRSGDALNRGSAGTQRGPSASGRSGAK